MSWWSEAAAPDPERDSAGGLLITTAQARQGGFLEAFGAGRREARFRGNTTAADERREVAYDRRIAALKAAGFDPPQHPTRGVWRQNRAAALLSRPQTILDQEREWARYLDRLKRTRRDLAATLTRPIEDEARDIGLGAGDEADAASERGGWLAGGGGRLAGNLVGALADPLTLVTLPAGYGGGAIASKTIASQVLGTAAREAAVNAAVTAAATPKLVQNEAELGVAVGPAEALEQIGFAALLGAGVGGAGKALELGVQRLARPRDLRPAQAALEAAVEAAPTRELVRAVQAAGPEAPPEAQAAVRILEAADAMAPARPPGVEPAAHDEAVERFARALAFGEAIEEPPRPARAAAVALPAEDRAGGVLMGKPYGYASLDPRDVGAEPDVFQYKGGGDGQGVTSALADVAAFDRMASGDVFFFEYADGRTVIADGHQRRGLALRAIEAGQDGVVLDGYVFREADGWTARDVRVLAGKQNLRLGTGDVLDSAAILREAPDLLDRSVRQSTDHMREARAISRLSEEAYRAVRAGVVEPRYAALAQQAAPADPDRHMALIRALAETPPANVAQARVIIGDALMAPLRSETTASLFGEVVQTRSLTRERAQVLDQALKALAADKQAFGLVAREAERLASAGNVIAEAASAQRAMDAAQLRDLITALAVRRGVVSDALSAAAGRVADGEPATRQARAFLEQLRGLSAERGLRSLMEDAPARLEGASVDAPGDAAAALQARAAEAALGLAPPAPLRPAADVQLERWIAEAGPLDLDQLFARAAVTQERLTQAGQAIADALGVAFKDPGLKDRATAADKIGRKAYQSAAELTDVARGGFIVRSPAEAEAVVARLAAALDVIDEGWKKNRAGYVDRKVLVRAPGGAIGEVQLWWPEMHAAKNVGTSLYTRERSLPEGQERDALRAQQRAIYSAAIPEAWRGVGGKDLTVGNSAANVASDTSSPLSNTSIASQGVQSASPRRITNAGSLDRSPNTTAGRRSQLNNSMSFPLDNSKVGVGDGSVKDAALLEAASLSDGEGTDLLGVQREAERGDALVERFKGCVIE